MKYSCKKGAKVLLGLFLAVAVLGGGCSGAPKKDAPLTELHVSYATRPLNVPSLVGLDQKLFENAFAADHIQVVWHELAGVETVEALAAGSIDIATSLNYLSSMTSKAAGSNIKIIAGYSAFPQAIALVAARESGIKSMSDLPGKKVALQQGTMLHEMFIKGLAEEGLSVAGIEIIGLESPEALAALLGGQIDATILPEPLLTRALASDKAVLIRTAEGLISGQTVIAAREGFLEKNPAVARKFLEVHQACLEYAAAHEEDVQALCAAALEMPLPAVRKLYPKITFSTQLDSAVLEEMKMSIEFLKTYGIIEAKTETDVLLANLLDLNYGP